MASLLVGTSEQGDHELRTILALYDSSELLAKLEEAVRVLTEMIPTGLVDHEELLDDALAVVCGDLCQIMELGIKDPSLITILSFLREMSASSKQPSHRPVTHLRKPDEPEISSLPHPAVDPAKREVLFAAVIDLFKSPTSRQKFLAFLDDDSSIAELYLSFAPLRSHTDCLRISRALRSLPQVAASQSASKPTLVVGTGEVESHVVIPEIVVNSPSTVPEEASSSREFTDLSPVKELQSPPSTSGIRTKATLHTRSRSNLDGIPANRNPTRRLSFSRTPTAVAASLPDREPAFSPSYFSPPKPGQSLIGYLQSQDTETCADLERENAHFFVSDVIIAAVEQMQYERRHATGRWAETNTLVGSASDDDGRRSPVFGGMRLTRLPTTQTALTYRDMVSDGQSSSTGTTSGSLEEEDDRPGFSLLESQSPEKKPTSHVPAPLSNGQSTTTRSREPNWRGRGNDQPSNSAEAVAVSLLRKFSEHRLPKASELDWLVSESDAPQRLLPLPNSTFISPDSGQPPEQYRIRGNLEWAPLRPQIIYHIQPHITLKVGIVNQKNRCAGCGGKMDTYQQSRMRFCEYTGKYFCVCCHEYKTSVIPARVLLKWDFTKHYVSNFAADFIARIYRDPLFDVSDCNMELYKKSKSLMQTRLIRTQLVLATEYMKTCRNAQSAMAEVEQLPKFVFEQIHTYSLDLFASVREGVLPTFLKPVADLAVQHVVNCPFCCSKGFICEFCRDTTPVFPFQVNSVFQCEKCFSCYHANCAKKKPCPKCARLQARKAASPIGAATA